MAGTKRATEATSAVSDQTVAPPRDFIAASFVSAVRGAGYGVALHLLLIAVIIMIDLAIDREWGVRVLAPLGFLIVFIGFYVAFVVFRSRRAALFLLIGGGLAAAIGQWLLLDVDPTVGSQGVLVLNRVDMALVLIGPVGRRVLGGLGWVTSGYLIGSATTAIAQLGHGLPVNLGVGPTVAFVVYVVFIITLANYRRVLTSSVPTVADDEFETARAVGRRELEESAVGLIHDTVLGDLRALAMLDGPLDARAVARFSADHALITGGELEEADSAEALRDELLEVIREFQWRGLSVDVSGNLLGAALSASTGQALRGALYACLDNVLAHSGTSDAEVILGLDGAEVTIMVVDHGSGFDPDAVPEDRLGLRYSVVKRMQGCGGNARIWSKPESGTSILLTAPVSAGSAAEPSTGGQELTVSQQKALTSLARRQAWTSIPGNYDRASRYLSPLAPWVLAGLCGFAGLGLAAYTWSTTSRPLIQLVAIVIIAIAPLILGYLIRPGGPGLAPGGLVAVIGCAWLGTIVSAYGYSDTMIPGETWWAPLATGFALGSLVNYISPLRMLLAGLATCILVGGFLVIGFVPQESYLPPLSAILGGLTTSMISIIVSVIIGHVTVTRLIRWSQAPHQYAPMSSGLLGEAARLRLLRHELALVRRHVVPLLERVVSVGRVGEADRSDAQRLGDELRRRLTARANSGTWLNRLALGRRLTVVDPDGRAEELTEYQRTTLTALIRGVLDDPAIGAPHLLVELQARMDGSTAVAVSFDLHLAEGRRVMLLAPHYLALQSAVDDLRWEGGERLRMRFKLPGRDQR